MGVRDRYNAKKKSNISEDDNDSVKVSAGGVKDRYAKKQKINELGLDTFNDDLLSTNSLIDGIYNEWQSEKDLTEKKNTVQGMYDRILSAKKYADENGGDGGNLTEIADVYKSVLDGWEDTAYYYSGFKNADEFNASKKNSEALRTADVGALNKELEELESMQKQAHKYEQDIKLLGNRKHTIEHRTRGLPGDVSKYDTQIEELTKGYDRMLKGGGYTSLEELNKDIAKKSQFRNNAERIQEWQKLGSVGDVNSENYDKNYDAYVKKGNEIPADNVGTSERKYVGRGQGATSISDSRAAAMALKERNGGGMDAYFEDFEQIKKYRKMTDDEFNNLAYYIAYDEENGTNKTSDYLKSIEETLASRRGMEWAKAVEGNIFGQYGMKAVSGLDQFATGIASNFTDADYIPTTTSQFASQKISYDLRDTSLPMWYNFKEGEWEDRILGRSLGQIGGDLIETSANMGPSILASAVVSAVASPVAGQIVGASLMGGSARGNAYSEMLNQGYSKGQANTYANLVGISEAGLQYALGGVGKLGGKLSNNLLSKAVSGLDDGLMKFAIEYGGAMASEGLEEGLQEVLTPVFKNIAAGYDTGARVNWSDVAYSALLGGLSGGLFEGSSATGTLRQAQYNKKMGADLRAGEQISGVFDLANNPEMAQAYEAYTRYANEGITAENITDAQLGNLYNTATADAQQGFVSANKDLAKAKKTIEKQKAIRENEYWSDGIRNRATEKLDKAIAKQTEAQQKRVANAEVLEKIGGINTAVARTKIQKAVEKKKADREKRKAEIAELSSGVEVSSVAETGKAIDIKGIKVDKGETTIVTSDGDIALDKVELSDRDAALIRFAKGADSQAEAQLFLDTYDENINTDLEAYENDFTLVNAYAKSGGFSEDYIIEHKGSLSAEQVSNIYKETIIKQTLKKEADLTKLIANTANNAPYKGHIDDSIIDYKNKSTEGKVNWNKLNSRQKQSVEFLKVFATKAGMNLVFEGYSETMNGAFNIVDNTIHVSLNAGITETHLTDTIIPTASHEITHWMEEKSPELYNKLATMVLDALSADRISREARIKAEIDRLDASHPDKKHDERDAVNEIVAKACEDMLAMSKEGRKLFESMTEEEQKTFVGKIKEIIANLKKWIDEFLSSYKADSEEAKALRNYKEKLEEISKVWDEMLVRSIEVNQAMEKADIFGNLKNGISADGTTIVGKNKLQMSDKTYRDGGRDFLIKWLDGQKDISKADKQNIIEQTDRVAAIMRAIDEGGEIPEYSRWANLEVVKDENGDKVLSVIVKNGDYAMNIDFSQVCKKRVALNAVLNKMVQSGDLANIILDETDISELNAIIKNHDFEIACALCFVDSKRYRVDAWAKSFCEGSDEKKSGKIIHKYGFNEMVRSLIPKGSGINVDEFNFTNRDIKNQPTENLLSEADNSQLDFSLIDSIIENNDAKSAQHRYAKAIKENPDIRKILNHSEIISSIGLDTIRLESPKLYGLINGHQGTAKPKFSHDVVAYGNDVLKASNFTPERAKMVGGVRCQSFSDFMAVMVVDYAQFISELAAKKLTAHSYTKEPLFVKLFGLTGMKINMSLVPKAINMTPEQQEKFAILKDESVSKKSKAYKTAYEEYMKLTENAGLDDNGNYIWEDETFPYDIAMEIVVDKRYSKNCGTIAVGISNNHIKKLLADPTISMVIPYHKSGLNHEVAMMRDIALYRDYTEYQNTRDKKTGKKLEKGQADFDFYGDLYGVDGKEGTHDPKQTAENYKKWCYENNYIPKFDEFMLDENYYKLLIDFRVYDVDGTYVEQQPVQTIYPDNAEFEDLILNGVKDKNGKVYGGLKQQQANTDRLDSESQQIVDEYKQMLKEKHGYQFQFSMKQKAEETHDLIAFHNITEKKLLDALAHGKLIMPSIAVSNMGMTDFGDISMVFGKDTIDPDRDASNKLYGSDAWTPTQTSMKKNPKFDDSKTTNVVNSIKKAIGNNWSEVFDYNTVKFKKAIESADGSIYDAFAENIGVQASYAINNGIISAIPKTKNGKIDKEALKDSLDAKLNKDEVWRAYKVWLENISNTMITSYDKATNEEILRNMKAQPDSAKTFKLSVSGELIVPAIPYSSVQDLRNNKHRLSSDADNHAKIVGADFLTWADNTSKSTGVPVEQVVKAINESFESRYNIPSITKAFNDRGIALTDVEAISLQALYKTAVELPTRYFEAKPGRTVGFDEVATAIIPNTTSAELRSVLDKNNISYTEYEAGNDNARLKALNSLEGVKFSEKGYVAYDSTALLKESTIDTYLKDYASKSSPNYAQAYITYMSPYHFLELTTSSVISRRNIERESTKFEKERFEEATQYQPIQLEIDHETGEVIGHEGRHRMVALDGEGIYNVPVLLFDSSNKYNKENLNGIELVGQFNKYNTAMVDEAIPLSYANRDLIIEKFGTKSSMQKMGEKYGWKQTLQYSDKNSSSVYDIVGEKNRLLKENEAFKDEVERLKEALKLEKQVTHGNHFNENQLTAVAKHLLKISNSEYSGKSLIAELKDIYSYIAQSKELTWDDLFSKCYEVARKMLGKENPDVAMNDFFKELGMREVSEAYAEYESEEQTRWLANEIYNQYWNVSSIKTTADKYDKQMQMLKWKHRQAMDKLRSEYKERAEQKAKSAKLLEQMYYGKKLLEKDKEIARQKLADDMYYGKIIHNLQVKREQEADRLKAYGKERLDSFKERAEQKARIQSITGNARILNEMLVKNSKDKHIPEAMKPVVEELLQAIDFSSKRLLEGGEATQKDIRLANAFRNLNTYMLEVQAGTIEESLEEFYGAELPERLKNLVKTVDAISEHLGEKDFILNKMSLEELNNLSDIIKIVKSAINNINKFHDAHIKASIDELGFNTEVELEKRKNVFKDDGKSNVRNKKHFDKLKVKQYWNNLNPYYAFKNLGESAMQIFRSFMDAQDKASFLSKEVIEFTQKLYDGKQYKKWSETFFTFEVLQPNGKKAEFSLNVPQIMSLHCLVKQEDARKHILHGNDKGDGGGITIVETTKTEAVLTNILLKESDLDNILATLDDTDAVGNAKEVADKLQEYMGTRGAELGNEISMKRFGIKAFGIENYFPIKVSDGTVSNKSDLAGVKGNSMLALLNMSFTHNRNKFAEQSVEIGDIFDVFSSHMSDMIRYNAFAMPILDMYRWMNFHYKDNTNNEHGVQTAVRDTFGKYAWSYLVKFMEDVNGSTKKNTRDNIAVKFFKNAKVAKVAANIRVMLLQFTSYVRAGAVIDNKYLLRAISLKDENGQNGMKKAQKYCGIAVWKSLGYYDVDITRSLADQIKHADTAYSKIIDFTLKGAEWADKLTWGLLWNACELEIRDTRKDLKVGSDEFYQAINERLREVIYRTQVVDSVLTRSQMMRSADGWDKVLTTFASENTLSFNLVSDIFTSYILDKRSIGKDKALAKNGKYMRKAITAYIATNIVTSAIASMFDAFRDYDEEDKDEEYWTKLMLENFASNMSFFNKLPYINIISSVVSGYSASRLETGWIESAFKAYKEISKIAAGEGSTEKFVKNSFKAFSDATGIAAYNVYRDIQSMYELFDD